MVTKSCDFDKEKLVNFLIEANNKSWKKTILQLIDMLDATEHSLNEIQFELFNTQNELYRLKIEMNQNSQYTQIPNSWLKDSIRASEAFYKEDPKVVVPTVSDDAVIETNSTTVHVKIDDKEVGQFFVERTLGIPTDENKVTPF